VVSDEALERVTGGYGASHVDPYGPDPPNDEQRLIARLEQRLRVNDPNRLLGIQADEASRRMENEWNQRRDERRRPAE